MSQNSKIRNYCVTFFEEPQMRDNDKIRYAIYGKEICPTTGKIHWQSYIELNTPQRISALKKLYDDNTLHAEKRRGTRDQAREYCMKDNNYTEHGKWISGQGHRSDLDSIVDQMKEGKSLEEIMLEYPKHYCRYRNGLKDIAATITVNNIPDFRELEVTLITGPTGCGKTRKAMEHAQFKIQGEQLQWWDGYQGESTILIDEYDNNVPISKILGILDGYKLRLDVKGSFTYAAWNKVYITTNLKMDELHSNAKDAHRDALFRRITHIEDMWDDELHR